MRYAFAEDSDEENMVRVYKEEHPHTMRDQGLRAGDDLVRVVLWDVEAVLRDAGYVAEADKAQKLCDEAEQLGFDDNGWCSEPDDSEKLRWILEEAENIDHIYVDFDGDCGVVRITISDLWEEIEGNADDIY